MDNKAPGNNGIGKKIRNIGMAAVAAVTLGVGGKHVVEELKKSEQEQKIPGNLIDRNDFVRQKINDLGHAKSIEDLNRAHISTIYIYPKTSVSVDDSFGLPILSIDQVFDDFSLKFVLKFNEIFPTELEATESQDSLLELLKNIRYMKQEFSYVDISNNSSVILMGVLDDAESKTLQKLKNTN